MDKKFTKEQKVKLQKEKKRLEKELGFLAEKNKKVEDDWTTKYPRLDGGDLEAEADEVEEYGNLLPVSQTLELELKKITEALDRIKGGTYGVCDKCKKSISKQRLKVYPQAKYCRKCAL